ncbi:MAG: hypothetical protein L6V93_19660 [Clostridiales bacterium]|nr:MAG: hypothetical protein L6V93_19660 [Clostridiales bacterium]
MVVLYMIIMYRLCGFISGISLAGYITLVLMILSWLKINLTLPGIAGIILTIGTAVDANVIIFLSVLKRSSVSEKHCAPRLTQAFKKSVYGYFGRKRYNSYRGCCFVLLRYGQHKRLCGYTLYRYTGKYVHRYRCNQIFLLQQLIGFNIKNSKLYSA